MKSLSKSIHTGCLQNANSWLRRAALVAIVSSILLPRLAAASGPQEGAAPLSRLEELLRTTNFSAVEEAGKLGPPALSVIRRHVKDENYRSRQLAMLSAGRIGVEQSADILATGLLDENLNVQNAAANELAKKSYPGAASVILTRLTGNTNELVKEKLALAAGYLTLEQIGEALKPIAKGRGVLASNARMALARLRDREAQQTILAELTASSPRERYDALEKLIYVNDRSYVSQINRLLQDKSEAVRVGPVEMPRYRRVCDQAVDTLVSLLQAKTSFPVGADKVYSDEEIGKLRVDLKLN